MSRKNATPSYAQLTFFCASKASSAALIIATESFSSILLKKQPTAYQSHIQAFIKDCTEKVKHNIAQSIVTYICVKLD